MSKPARGEHGAVALEFVLVLPFTLLIIGMLLVTGLRAVYAGLAEAEVREAARTASIRKGFSTTAPYPTENEICDSVDLPVPGTTLASPPDGCRVINQPNLGSDQGVGDIVTVELTYNLDALDWLDPFSIEGFDTVTRSASVMRE